MAGPEKPGKTLFAWNGGSLAGLSESNTLFDAPAIVALFFSFRSLSRRTCEDRDALMQPSKEQQHAGRSQEHSSRFVLAAQLQPSTEVVLFISVEFAFDEAIRESAVLFCTKDPSAKDTN